MLFTELPGTC
ncbi:hypothetical protein BDFB_002521 [Asbolus verrucosus]|uniref:Uncharacterized protein n=1 Tax=Asbolus verrucosus TaxID=1661398 RepID=A0A482VDU1_ASBVE|nr:hypothetical protein BDFB_002521 [Asbolus verrucosus]